MPRRRMTKKNTNDKVMVRLLVPEAGNGRVFPSGSVRELTQRQAENYVELGRGELVEATPEPEENKEED